MAVAWVQDKWGGGSGITQLNVTFDSSVTAGNTIIAAIGISAAPVVTMSDTLGNTYNFVLDHKFSPGWLTSVQYWANSPSGGANTVTADFDGTVGANMSIIEASGLADSGIVDDTNDAHGTGTTPDAGTVTTTRDNCLLVAHYNAATSVTYTAGTGYTLVGTGSIRGTAQWRAVSSTSTYASSCTISVSEDWSGTVVAYREELASARGQVSWAEFEVPYQVTFKTHTTDVRIKEELERQHTTDCYVAIDTAHFTDCFIGSDYRSHTTDVFVQPTDDEIGGEEEFKTWVNNCFNTALVLEQLWNLGYFVEIRWVGFAQDPDDSRLVKPNDMPEICGYTTDPSTGQLTVPDVAYSGEVRIFTVSELDSAKRAEIQALLEAHDCTEKTDTQSSEDTDEDGLDRLEILYAKCPSSLSDAEKDEALCLLMRLELRRSRELLI